MNYATASLPYALASYSPDGLLRPSSLSCIYFLFWSLPSPRSTSAFKFSISLLSTQSLRGHTHTANRWLGWRTNVLAVWDQLFEVFTTSPFLLITYDSNYFLFYLSPLFHFFSFVNSYGIGAMLSAFGTDFGLVEKFPGVALTGFNPLFKSSPTSFFLFLSYSFFFFFCNQVISEYTPSRRHTT